jgi:hypothetical protein
MAWRDDSLSRVPGRSRIKLVVCILNKGLEPTFVVRVLDRMSRRSAVGRVGVHEEGRERQLPSLTYRKR